MSSREAEPVVVDPAAPVIDPPVVVDPAVVVDPVAEVPIKYELKLGEGSPLATADLDQVTAFAVAQKLSPEVAAALLKYQEETTGSLINRQKEAIEAQKVAWGAEIEADKELGGERLQATIDRTKRLMDRLDPDSSVRAILDSTGVGNNPAMVKFIDRIARGTLEDKPVGDRTADGSAKKSHADIMYGA